MSLISLLLLPLQLLGLQSKCLHMSSEGRTLYALKQHVVTAIYHKAVSSLSTKSEKDTLIIWKGIYQGLDARKSVLILLSKL